MNTHKHNPFLWIPTLSAAEEIPTAIITFIALLMFLQFGEGMAMSSLYASLLFVPFVLKSFLRSKVRSAGYFKINLHIAEVCIFVMLMVMEYCISHQGNNVFLLFLIMFVISSLCAWHELLGRMYYDRMLYPRQQKVFNKTKILAVQTSIVLTYGVLIIFLGFFEVIFRMPSEIQTKRVAWAMECYIIAGAFLFFMMVNFLLLKNPRVHNPYRYESMRRTVMHEMLIIDRIRQNKYSVRIILALFLLLLPQSLMFHTRVFFLLSRESDGGMDCSIPEIGFAQGTIGVIAFGVGLLSGRRMLEAYGSRHMFWYMAIPLTLSPIFYMGMSYSPQVDNMLLLCLMCLFAQLFFGFGLNIAVPFVRFVSGERYRNTIGYLYIPLIAAVMLIPMALSGFLCQLLGFRYFFTLDTVLAPAAWIVVTAMNIKNLVHSRKE